MQPRSNLGGVALALLVWSASTGATALQAQQQIQPWQNSPLASEGQPVFPFMEGWYDNGDGTYTISFGYLNRNSDETLEIPFGERNYIEPEQYDGMQPTTFLPSRNRGIFGITIPADQRDQDIWWYLTDTDGTVYKVPGRTRAEAYQLDWNPRPHGSVTPLMWFGSEEDAGRGPEGVWAEEALTTSVNTPITLTVNTRDVSERDVEDPRFQEPVPVRIVWSKYQGPPGEVTFTRHESNPAPEEPEGGRGGGRGGRFGGPPPPEQITLDGVEGSASVIAAFHTPGDYVMRAQADNWNAPDSSSGDQCCWSNAYLRVTVTP
jgi:hypothetical protein